MTYIYLGKKFTVYTLSYCRVRIWNFDVKSVNIQKNENQTQLFKNHKGEQNKIFCV